MLLAPQSTLYFPNWLSTTPWQKKQNSKDVVERLRCRYFSSESHRYPTPAANDVTPARQKHLPQNQTKLLTPVAPWPVTCEYSRREVNFNDKLTGWPQPPSIP